MIPDRQPDLFRRLKPLYGKTLDALWLEYQTADPERRREIENVLNIIAMKRLGLGAGEDRLLLEPPSRSVSTSGEYCIGCVSYPGIAPYGVRLRRQDLLRHVFILGPTGTGKSTLIILLLTQFLDDMTPFMVFDFKRNYRCLIDTLWGERVLVLTVGRDVAPVSLNALQPPRGVEFGEWAAGLADIISTSYLLMQGARNVLMEALLAAHRDHGAAATLRDAHQVLAMELRAGRSGSRRYGWLESSTRSLEELSKGGFGAALNGINGMDVQSLLTRPVVFELEGLGDDQRRFFCLYFLYAIMQLRKHGTAPREVLQHVLVFDEAHNVFPKEQFGQLGVPSRLAREVREYGEAIIAATQQADVSDSLIANSGVKIILRTDYPKDVEFASKLLQLETKWFPKLSLGTGIIRLPARFYTPFLFTFWEQPIKNWIVTDDGVRHRYDKITITARPTTNHAERLPTPESTDGAPGATTPSTAESSITVSEQERALLADIATEPICGITARYERLGWYPRTGNDVKDGIIAKRLATFEIVTTNKGRIKILTLTPAGVTELAAHGLTVPAKTRCGAEHEYWRAALKRVLQEHGYAVSEEYTIVEKSAVDLHGTKGEHHVSIEIETGKSDIAANIQKCAELSGTLVFFFVTTELRDQWRPALPPDALAITPTDLAILTETLRNAS